MKVTALGNFWGIYMPVMINPEKISVTALRKDELQSKIADSALIDPYSEDSLPPMPPKVAMGDTLKIDSIVFDLATPYEDWLINGLGLTDITKELEARIKGGLPAISLPDRSMATLIGDGMRLLPQSWDLEDEDISVIPHLRAAYRVRSPVKFVWGSFEFEGLINEFGINYDYYTRWGAPLRGELNIQITSCDLSKFKAALQSASLAFEAAMLVTKGICIADDTLT